MATAAASFHSLVSTTATTTTPTTTLSYRLLPVHLKPHSYSHLSGHLRHRLRLSGPPRRTLLLPSAAASSISPAADGQEDGRLYVGNLPFSMTADELAEAFAEAGTVDSVDVIYDRITDRSRGFAFVNMSSHEEAVKAIQMFDGSQMGGRTVRVNFPEVPRGGERALAPGARARAIGHRAFVDSPYKIYAGNLGWSVRSDTLKEAFAAQPGLLGAKVIFERDTGRSRGFGFVSFERKEDMQAAMEAMNGVEVEGRPLRLSHAEGRTTASSPPGMESQVQLEGSTLQSSEAEMEESNLQTTASY